MGHKASRGGRIAALGVAVLVGGLWAPAASGGQPGDGATSERESRELLYHCDTEAGQRDVRVRVTLALPEATAEPIGVTVRTTLDAEVVDELAAGGATEVTGVLSATLHAQRTAASDDETGEPVLLPDLTVPTTPLPADGPVTLVATGEADEITPEGAGEFRVSADRFNLLLGWPPPEDSDDGGGDPDPVEPPGDGDEGAGDGDDEEGGGGVDPVPDATTLPGTDGGGAAAQARRQAPPARGFDCVPAPDQDTVITTLTVADDGTTRPGDDPRGPGNERSGEPGTGRSTDAEPVDIPDDCVDFADLNNAWCAYLGGYTNLDRMNAAALVEPGIVNLALPVIAPCNDGSEWFWFCQTALAEVRHDGKKQLPPTRNAFHAFDFMPNEATLELTQIGDMTIDVRSQVIAPYDGSVVAHATLGVRVYDVTVNGVVLDVGDDCRTEEPITVALTADYPGDYTPAAGGFLDGYTDIPPFTGCGVGEDLDPLLTGLISGKDNYVKMTQGAICDIRTERTCPPAPPELQR
ncbi:DUF6801 domain-containing protein [Saccharomonospora azurea]|uniref:DUF6801 domain-containing protein n=1 Tax=Saccharomonospora azurea TaxID=40988 RepID=UPI003D93F27A